MSKLNNNKLNKLIWVISAVICCLLFYFVCLPFYQHQSSSGSISVLEILSLFVYSIFFLIIVPIISYITALFLIDRLKLSQQVLLRNKITGILTTMIVLIIIFSPVISLKKQPILNTFFQVIVFWLIIPMTVILLSRFVFQKVRKYPVLLGIISFIVFILFGFLYLSLAGIRGEQSYGMGLFVLFESLAICLVSIVVNLFEAKKMKSISERTIK